MRLDTAAALLRDVRRQLTTADIRTAELDARLLVTHALGIEHLQLVADPGLTVSPDAAGRAADLLARRLRGEPVSRLLGTREFYGRSFMITPATLDPRPDTETLIDASLAVLRRRNCPDPRILDLGTGSGCIILTLLSELPAATGWATDRNQAALAVARHNAVRLGLDNRAQFVVADWLEGIDQTFDLVVSNPPYIPTDEIATLETAVKDHDPWMALDGGSDGLEAFRRIAPGLRAVLRPGGFVALEVGTSAQSERVSALFAGQGFFPLGDGERVVRDLAGRARVVLMAHDSSAEMGFGERKKMSWKASGKQIVSPQ